jgi:streptogramin lyase
VFEPAQRGSRDVSSANIEKITQRTLAMSSMESTGTQDYNFPQRRPAMSLRRLFLFTLAATIAGFAAVATLSVQIKEYEVPTPHSRPHDPALAPDGSLWYTGQGANKLGRLDPKTGEFKEYRLKTPASGPHGLVADKDGNIWFTAISGGYVGELDPKTGAIAEYRPSDGSKIDPHTPVFDHNGILWFTNEETNYIGRLDPKTGKMILTKSPTPHAVPYGIVITKENVPFFCEFGTNKLASIDPNTMRIREYTLPAESARPRRIALGPDGTIYYTDFARGYLGHFDPASGKAPEGVGFPRRNGFRTVWDRDHKRCAGLVQRVGREAQYPGQVRSQIREL